MEKKSFQFLLNKIALQIQTLGCYGLRFYYSVRIPLGVTEGIANCPKIVPREEWGAQPPTCYDSVTRPVKYVVIHHTHSPPACFDRQNCSAAMRSMQRFHQGKNWCDIGYK